MPAADRARSSPRAAARSALRAPARSRARARVHRAPAPRPRQRPVQQPQPRLTLVGGLDDTGEEARDQPGAFERSFVPCGALGRAVERLGACASALSAVPTVSARGSSRLARPRRRSPPAGHRCQRRGCGARASACRSGSTTRPPRRSSAPRRAAARQRAEARLAVSIAEPPPSASIRSATAGTSTRSEGTSASGRPSTARSVRSARARDQKRPLDPDLAEQAGSSSSPRRTITRLAPARTQRTRGLRASRRARWRARRDLAFQREAYRRALRQACPPSRSPRPTPQEVK